MRKHSLFILYFLFTQITAFAQNSIILSSDNSLSSSLVTKVFQDDKGFVWISTLNGLNKYDGTRTVQYNKKPGDPNSLRSNYINVINQDKNGYLIIGMIDGLQRYDYARDRFDSIPMLLENGDEFPAYIASILNSSDGKTYIGTSGHGIFIVEDDYTSARQKESIVPSYFIIDMMEDSFNNKWIITDEKGVFKCGKDTVSYFGKNENQNLHFMKIFEDSRGNIFLGTVNNGVYQYDRIKDCFEEIPGNIKNVLPIKDFAEKNDLLLVATDGDGVLAYDRELKVLTPLRNYSNDFDLSKSKVHSLLCDKDNNMWMGIYQKGVLFKQANPNNFDYIGYKSEMKNIIGSGCILSIYRDHKDVLWVGTDNDGLYGIDPDGRQLYHFKHSSDPTSVPSTILSICEDSENNLWLGSYVHGMAKLDLKTGRCKYYYNEKSDGNHYIQRVFSIKEDRDKNLWIGTMGLGLIKLNVVTEKIEVFENRGIYPDPINNNWINSLMISSDNILYVASVDGLCWIDLKTMEPSVAFENGVLLWRKSINALYEDKAGYIWVGTDNGLYMIDFKSDYIAYYTTNEGLQNNMICAITGDDQDNIWISTYRGVSKFNKSEKVFVSYNINDGLQGNEFSRNACFRDKYGNIFLGGLNGITAFDPSVTIDFEHKADLFLTGFYLNDKNINTDYLSDGKPIIEKSVSESEEFSLSHKDNSFALEFSSLSYNNDSREKLSYSVNNGGWHTLEPGIKRIYFNNMSPGKYKIRVKSVDYNAESDIKEYLVDVRPAVYFSFWAKMIYLFLFVSLLGFIFYMFRLRILSKKELNEHMQMEQINESKLQFFMNISHEIRTPMSLIVSPLEKLMDNDPDPERNRSYSIIYRNTQRILRLINQLMDVRKIDKKQMVLRFREMNILDMIGDVYKHFEPIAVSKNILFKINCENPQLKLWVDPLNFDKVIMNLLSNAFKFTPEDGKIVINISSFNQDEKEFVRINVVDSGIGIKEENVEKIFNRFYQVSNSDTSASIGTGIGLHLTKTLVEMHHGEIICRNNDSGPGACFSIVLPLGNDHLESSQMVAPDDIYTPQRKNMPDEKRLVCNDDEQKQRSKTKYKVLIVEDDEEIRKYLRSELSADFHISECSDGKEGFTHILKNLPDLVISDIMMPELDGISLCQKIKKNININHIPVVLLTAKTDSTDQIEGLKTGADAYVTKPFNIEMLRITMHNILKNRDILKNNFNGSQNQEEKVEKIELKSSDEKLMERIMSVINKNISDSDLNVEMIASEVGISRVHLHRKLKELTNQSTRDFLRNIRLKQAAELLSEKNIAIADVAYATGFTNLAHFSTKFKEVYGVSPKEYMKDTKEELAEILID